MQNKTQEFEVSCEQIRASMYYVFDKKLIVRVLSVEVTPHPALNLKFAHPVFTAHHTKQAVNDTIRVWVLE